MKSRLIAIYELNFINARCKGFYSYFSFSKFAA